MDFYLKLLEQQYSFLESQHQKFLAPSNEVEEVNQTCPCGLVWIDECKGCEEGELFKQEQEQEKFHLQNHG
jgi:hypothetical protein